jgi:hypothetical protein
MEFQTVRGNCVETLGDRQWCEETHVFGARHEAYEAPAVMACCDAEGVSEDLILQHCAADLIDQVCRSIPLRIQALLDKKLIKVGKDQARALRNWIRANQQECFDTLARQADIPGVIVPARWKINGGKNKKWPLLSNFTIVIKKGVVKSVTLPDEDERVACLDPSYNNGEIFEYVGPITPVRTVQFGLSEETTQPAVVEGPSMPGGTTVNGISALTTRSSCDGPRCSSIRLAEDSGVLVLEDLNLFASGAAVISYGSLPVELDRAALRLYGASRGEYDSAYEAYVINPGDAHFVISGAQGDAPALHWAANSTPIVLRPESGGWVGDSFSITHVDGAGHAWTVSIPPTTWK